jgi:hypothetical protein
MRRDEFFFFECLCCLCGSVCAKYPFGARTVVKLPGSQFFAGSVLQEQSDQEIIPVRAWRPGYGGSLVFDSHTIGSS